ncbi:Grh1p [Sporobolomyces koalae]|uniref:Grh1p n=1 Tax=Sporobolomyces koalae TaxID=500713 RepID=UPI00317AA3F8
MGQAESTAGLSSHDPSLPQDTLAFHVLRVAENSPAANAGLDPFFDFIVGVNGTQLRDEIDTFTQVLESSEGRQVRLMVYSTKRKEIRGESPPFSLEHPSHSSSIQLANSGTDTADVVVIPSREWSSQGQVAQVDGEPSLLGLSLRLCNPQHALEQVWHVLEVLEGSPAQSAGLVPFGDWIIGYSGGVLRGEGDFYDVVESHTDKPLRLFVYNSDYDVTREAILVPNRTWGGEGLLGAGVGYGLLHRIPKPQDRPRVSSAVDQPAQALPSTAAARPPSSGHLHQQAPPPPPPASSQQYRSPPRSSTSPSSFVSPPPPRGSTLPPSNRLSSQPSPASPSSIIPPPPPRRTAAVSPPPTAPATTSRSKYIPAPPKGSPARNPPPAVTTTPTKKPFTEHPSFRYHEDDLNASTAISFGGGNDVDDEGSSSRGYDVSAGVSITPQRDVDDHELDDQVYSSPTRTSYRSGGGGGSGYGNLMGGIGGRGYGQKLDMAISEE